MPVTARSDKADTSAVFPDRLIAAGICIFDLYMQCDQSLCRSIAVALADCCIASNKVRFVLRNPTVHASLRG